jgi:CheY-like chemotaxis protein
MKGSGTLPILHPMHRPLPTVLLMDQQAEARAVVAGWLVTGGFRCSTAEDPASALRVVTRASPRVVVIQTGRGGRNARWPATHLSERDIPPGVVVLAPARHQAQAPVHASQGVPDVLQQPCGREALLARALNVPACGIPQTEDAALVRGAGSRLDPSLVRLCLDMMDDQPCW